MNKKHSFEEIFAQNKRRIYYQISKLNIDDPYNEYFHEGLYAMWNAYEKYDADKGPLSTYFNYAIRHHLIDKMKKENRIYQNQKTYVQEQQKLYHANFITSYCIYPNSKTPISDLLNNNTNFREKLISYLSKNQRKWLYYAVICEMPLKAIAAQENTTADVVKGWAKETRRKLQSPYFRNFLHKLLND